MSEKHSTYRYNGNISEIEWRIHSSADGISSADEPSYTFKYDRANRLVRASYANPHNPNNPSGNTDIYYTVFGDRTSETTEGGTVTAGIGYDANGNFLNLKRNNGGIGSSFMKEYKYAYEDGTNRLKNTDNNTSDVYTYGAAGNVISNSDRDITSILYDPSTSLRTGSGLRTGKLYKPHSSGFWTVNTRYVRGAFGELLAQYDDDQLQYWNILSGGETIGRHHAGKPPIGQPSRYYYIKDHTSTTLSTGLGSVRVTATANGTVAGYDDYYPFGLQMPGRFDNSGNPHDDQKFTGHFLEQEGGLGIYHAGARLYDPEVPRFYGVDVMRGLYPGWSSYVYAMNNPVFFIDTTGNCPEDGSAGYSDELYDDAGNPVYCEEAIVIEEYRYDQHDELPPVNDYETESIVTVDETDYLLYDLRWIPLPDSEYVEVWVWDGTSTTLQKIPRVEYVRFLVYSGAGRSAANPIRAGTIGSIGGGIAEKIKKGFGTPFALFGATLDYSVNYMLGASQVNHTNREHDKRVRDQRSRNRRN